MNFTKKKATLHFLKLKADTKTWTETDKETAKRLLQSWAEEKQIPPKPKFRPEYTHKGKGYKR